MDNTGIITKESQLSFEETYSKLKMIIINNPNLKLLFELDHSANAAKVDKALRPTRILMFGNPNLGTPLMTAGNNTGLDLPQKMLVQQKDDGTVTVSYNDPQYLVSRHGIEGQDDIIQKVSGALDKISSAATSA